MNLNLSRFLMFNRFWLYFTFSANVTMKLWIKDKRLVKIATVSLDSHEFNKWFRFRFVIEINSVIVVELVVLIVWSLVVIILLIRFLTIEIRSLEWRSLWVIIRIIRRMCEIVIFDRSSLIDDRLKTIVITLLLIDFKTASIILIFSIVFCWVSLIFWSIVWRRIWLVW